MQSHYYVITNQHGEYYWGCSGSYHTYRVNASLFRSSQAAHKIAKRNGLGLYSVKRVKYEEGYYEVR